MNNFQLKDGHNHGHKYRIIYLHIFVHNKQNYYLHTYQIK